MKVSWALIAVCFGIALAGALSPPAFAKDKTHDPIIDPNDFVDGGGNPLPIDNPYFPLVPGTTFIYEAETEDGLEVNEVEVTVETKEILDVTCTVVLDMVWVEGVLTEETYDWYAQDKDGNVWYFGEDTKEYDESGNVISTEGSWEADVDGAKPGIVMEANPQPGDSYRQEYYEDVAEDMAKVLRLNASVSVPYGEFEDCLKTKEWTPLDRGVVEHKYYAWGVGLVLVTELKGKSVRVELVEITTD